ncbi:MAG: tRNA(Ile)(2)-agmatinylcytidine synthase [Methanimicrococcus sp.]|nr:tRNA(Ile)(2)-agmatinylcytidine synthase [Methanimicrococcus sp.]
MVFYENLYNLPFFDVTMFIGMDDTDSNEGMCTTYLAALLAEDLKAFGVVCDYPFLMRLNPTIPYKTRGNAALGISFSLFSDDFESRRTLISFVTKKIEEYAEVSCDKTNPGAVFIFDEAHDFVRRPLGVLFKKAVTDVIEIKEAADLLKEFEEKHGDSVFHFSMKNGRGLIGALAVCGAMLNPGWDLTYELLAYRTRLNIENKIPRHVDLKSLIDADQTTTPDTWDTVDYSKNKPFAVCVPGSPDPVLFGIRGKNPKSVSTAAQHVVSEPIERFQIFQTNQGTDAHILPISRISEMSSLHSYSLKGAVFSNPETSEGGHDIFQIKDIAGELLECAAFEPTGIFRHTIRQLIPGDDIQVYGSFKNNTLNLEKIKVLKLAESVSYENPPCPLCQKRMESAGNNQGFRCKKCKTKASDKTKTTYLRNLSPGWYEVPPSARRHLSKPLIRYSKEESDS